MKVIIAGSRHITDPEILEEGLEKYEDARLLVNEEITEVVCGMARGADMLGYNWAIRTGTKIAEFPADWEQYGKRAGYIRNAEMAEYADALIALWDGKSRGTDNMIQLMHKLGKPVIIVYVNK